MDKQVQDKKINLHEVYHKAFKIMKQYSAFCAVIAAFLGGVFWNLIIRWRFDLPLNIATMFTNAVAISIFVIIYRYVYEKLYPFFIFEKGGDASGQNEETKELLVLITAWYLGDIIALLGNAKFDLFSSAKKSAMELAKDVAAMKTSNIDKNIIMEHLTQERQEFIKKIQG